MHTRKLREGIKQERKKVDVKNEIRYKTLPCNGDCEAKELMEPIVEQRMCEKWQT
jgi:hypothetical protein